MSDSLILPVDIPTLAFSRGVMQMMLGGLILFLGTREEFSHGARWWAAGFLLNGVSLIVFPLQIPASWELARTGLNHLTLGASSICLLCGFWRFGRQPFQLWLLGLLVLMPLISLVAFDWLWPVARWRILLTAGSQAVALLAIQHSLGRPRRPELAVISRRMRYVVIAFLLVHLWSYGSLADVLPMTAKMEIDYHRSIFSVASLLFMLSLAVGCLALQFSLLAARSADLARIDWLTGLLNRRGFFHQAERLAELSLEHENAPNLIAIDIDHFKQINDRYGHAAGDQVLRALAEALKEELPDGGLLARLGGEEFCLLTVGLGSEGAIALAERVRQRCSEATVDRGAESIRFTFSAGVHRWLPGQTLDQALIRADQALYEAKHAGRNRVVMAAA